MKLYYLHKTFIKRQLFIKKKTITTLRTQNNKKTYLHIRANPQGITDSDPDSPLLIAMRYQVSFLSCVIRYNSYYMCYQVSFLLHHHHQNSPSQHGCWFIQKMHTCKVNFLSQAQETFLELAKFTKVHCHHLPKTMDHDMIINALPLCWMFLGPAIDGVVNFEIWQMPRHLIPNIMNSLNYILTMA